MLEEFVKEQMKIHEGFSNTVKGTKFFFGRRLLLKLALIGAKEIFKNMKICEGLGKLPTHDYDNRPRKAIEAAEKRLEKPTEESRINAANAAADAAATNAAAADAADAADAENNKDVFYDCVDWEVK